MRNDFKIFFDSPRPDSGAISFRGVGYREPMPPSVIDRPRGTGDYLFMYFYDEVEIRADGETALRPPGSMVIWPTGYYQFYGNGDHAYRHSWVHCRGSEIRQIIHANQIPVDTVMPVGSGDLAERYILEIHSQLTSYGTADPVIVRNLFENWMRELRRRLRGRETVPPDSILKARRFIESNYSEALALEQIAKIANLSVPHFCGEFKRVYGTGAIEYAIRLRMQQAAYLLRDVNLSVTEIARRVGYEDVFYFSKLFKKRFGMSPRAMRKSFTD
jgi:AraC-like DNA-binding protein